MRYGHLSKKVKKQKKVKIDTGEDNFPYTGRRPAEHTETKVGIRKSAQGFFNDFGDCLYNNYYGKVKYVYITLCHIYSGDSVCTKFTESTEFHER